MYAWDGTSSSVFCRIRLRVFCSSSKRMPIKLETTCNSKLRKAAQAVGLFTRTTQAIEVRPCIYINTPILFKNISNFVLCLNISNLPKFSSRHWWTPSNFERRSGKRGTFSFSLCNQFGQSRNQAFKVYSLILFQTRNTGGGTTRTWGAPTWCRQGFSS